MKQVKCYNHMQMNLKQQKITNILLNKRKLMIKIIYLYQQRLGKIKTIVYIEDIDYIYNSRSVLIKIVYTYGL